MTFFHGHIVQAQHILSDPEAIFYLIVFYPIIEELAFRGVIQEYIATKTTHHPCFYRISTANILTSVLFVLVHFMHNEPLWALLIFIPSLIFGYFKDQYNSIRASIYLHMFYNACSIYIIVQ